MGRIHREAVRQRQDALAQRPVQCPRQGLGLLGADEVGARHRTDDQRAAAEEGDRPVTVEEQVRQVLRRVARRADAPKDRPAEVEILAIVEGPMRKREVTAARGQDRGAQPGELTAAGHEVGVQMRLEAVRQLEAMLGREASIGRDIAYRIDDQRAPVAEVDHVR